MFRKLNKSVDQLSEFLAGRKGLLILIGILMVVVNLILQFVAQSHWLASSNLLLHLGIIIAFLGILLAWAL
jgi:hypothetical protein